MENKNNIRNVFPNKTCISCEHMEWDKESEGEENDIYCPVNQCIVKPHFVCDGYKGVWE